MELLKKRILEDGKILPGNVIKVDGFLNHQLDIRLINEMGKEFLLRFKDVKVDKILTIEASGIAIAAITAQYFDVPVVFAKKAEGKTTHPDTLTSKVYSFTKDKTYPVFVSRQFIKENENILIIDDFLANGQAVLGLTDIIMQAHAHCVGVGIVIEKGFQDGGQILKDKGLNLQSLVVIDSIEHSRFTFR
ncbi:MAG: xanthine phosphoribosyltransferase [Erysipelotrichaceae bacterium]